MRRLVFVQPAVPKYRVPFFDKISKLYNIQIFTSKIDFLGVKTVYCDDSVRICSGFISFFKNKILWMKGLPLIAGYSKEDVVVINGNPRIINYMMLFFILKLRGIKTVWWGHGWSAGSHGLLSKFRISMMRMANAVLVYTDKEKYALGLANAFALNNGLDSKEIQCSIKLANATRRNFDGVFYLVFIGRLTKKTNLELLLMALSGTNSKVHLNVIGDGENSVYYKSLAKSLGVADRIHWHGAVFEECDIAKVMLTSHAFIYAGSVGLSLIHAFNYGLPAIIHSNFKNHMPEFAAFKNDYNGVSFEEGNHIELSKKIEGFFGMDKDAYNIMSKNAFDTIVNSYNVDDMTVRFNNMIRAL